MWRRIIKHHIPPKKQKGLETRALRLLSSGQVNAVPLVTATFPFEEAPEAVAYAMN